MLSLSESSSCENKVVRGSESLDGWWWGLHPTAFSSRIHTQVEFIHILQAVYIKEKDLYREDGNLH